MLGTVMVFFSQDIKKEFSVIERIWEIPLSKVFSFGVAVVTKLSWDWNT